MGQAIIDTNDFPHWDVLNVELKGKVSTKVRRWAEYITKQNPDSLWYHGNSQWTLDPLPTYNKTTYTIKNDKGVWYCNCQGFQSKLKKGITNPECSHIQIVKIVAGARMKNKARERRELTWKD